MGTQRRILQAFTTRLQEAWFEEITLDEIAQAAGVTVQTVIRRFASKQGLLEAAARALGEEIRGRRSAPPGDTRGAIRALVDDYEITGDVTIRLLAQERLEQMQPVLTLGRAQHREWVERAFADDLEELPRAERDRRVTVLITLTDVYVWKLLRRDQHLSRNATLEAIASLVESVVRPGGPQ